MDTNHSRKVIELRGDWDYFYFDSSVASSLHWGRFYIEENKLYLEPKLISPNLQNIEVKKTIISVSDDFERLQSFDGTVYTKINSIERERFPREW